MKVAVVYDYIPAWRGGGEDTLFEIISHFAPNVDVYSAFTVDSPFSREFLQRIKKIAPLGTIKTGPVIKHLKPLLFRIHNFLLPATLQALPLQSYDLVISYTSFLSHSINPPKGRHILYMNTPARFLWNLQHSQSLLKKLSDPFLITDFMRYRSKLYDMSAMSSVKELYTISDATKSRILTFYNREAKVIYPPSVTEAFIAEKYKNDKLIEEFGAYYLHVSRVESYKNIDLLIRTVAEKGISENVIIVGVGPYYKTLLSKTQKILHAPATTYHCTSFQMNFTRVKNIFFAGNTPDKEKFQLFASSSAFFALNDEDFGITKVEAIATGVPIIGLRAGATPEIVEDGKNGILFEEDSVDSLFTAIQRHKSTTYNPHIIKQSATRFTAEQFHAQLDKVVHERVR